MLPEYDKKKQRLADTFNFLSCLPRKQLPTVIQTLFLRFLVVQCPPFSKLDGGPAFS